MPIKRFSSPEQNDHSGSSLRWLLTYADMVSLLLAFFVMLYSMSVISIERFTRAAASLRSEFGQPKTLPEEFGETLLPYQSVPSQPEDALDDMAEIERQLHAYVDEKGFTELVRTEYQARGLVISVVSDNLLFGVGEADLLPSAITILEKIAHLLANLDNPIAVEGHTCSLPIRTARFPSNWELSSARACSVVRYLIDSWHMNPTRLTASGYADSRPIFPNDREENRARNRRVELVILETKPFHPIAE